MTLTRTTSLLIAVLPWLSGLFAQCPDNLVPNPSFEDGDYALPQGKYPSTYTVHNPGDPAPTINHWYSPTLATPDWRHAQSTSSAFETPRAFYGKRVNVRAPRTGRGYVGLVSHLDDDLEDGDSPEYVEYIQVELKRPLVAGRTYDVRYHVSLAGLQLDSNVYSSNTAYWNYTSNIVGGNGLGAHLSTTEVIDIASTDISPLPVTPQIEYLGPPITDTTNWVPLSGSYVANGGERYLTIGTFRPFAERAFALVRPASLDDAKTEGRDPENITYFVLDDVSVVERPAARSLAALAAPPGPICPGASAQLTAAASGEVPTGYSWSPADGLADPSAATTAASPLATTVYTVTASYANGCTEESSVQVAIDQSCCTVGVDESARDVLDASCDATGGDGAVRGLSDTGAFGTPTYRWTDERGVVVGTEADLEGLAPGSYVLTVYDGDCSDAAGPFTVGGGPAPVIDESRLVVLDAETGQSDGAVIDVEVLNVDGREAYTWRDGGGNVVGTSLDLIDVPAGSYTLTVSKAPACSRQSGPHFVDEVAGSCGQELITNGGFEQYDACPTAYGEIARATGWRGPASLPTGGGAFNRDAQPEYYHACGAALAPEPTQGIPDNPGSSNINENHPPTYQQDGMIGLWTAIFGSGRVREYAVQELAAPLAAGQSYDISYWYRLKPDALRSFDRLGVYFGSAEPTTWASTGNTSYLDVAPQVQTPPGQQLDSRNAWAEVSDTYVATGGERFVVLGFFHGDPGTIDGPATRTPIYYLDNFSIAFAPSPQIDDSAVDVDPVTCGSRNGAVRDLVVSGTSGQEIYIWRDGGGEAVGTELTLSHVEQGSYTLTVLDGGCEATAGPYDVLAQPGPSLDESAATVADASCGSPTGQVSGLAVNGGAGAPTFEWTDALGSTVGTGLDLIGVAGGDYTLVVRDAGCVVTSATYFVDDASTLTIEETALVIEQASSGGSDGAVRGLAIAGASGSPAYSWETPAGTVVGTDLDLTNVGRGDYTLTVTDGSCQAVVAYSVPGADQPTSCSAEFVTNGDFSAVSSCPTDFDQLSRATGWAKPSTAPPSAGGGNYSTSDFFHVCGTGNGKTPNAVRNSVPPLFGGGAAYIGFGVTAPGNPGNREYLVTRLSSPMTAGEEYEISFAYRFDPSRGQAFDRLGVYLAPAEPSAYYPGTATLDVTPQVTTPAGVPVGHSRTWQTFSATFVATGGEEVLVLGVFHEDAPYSLPKGTGLPAYNIDVVSVRLVGDIGLDAAGASVTDASACGLSDGAISGLTVDGPLAGKTFAWRDSLGGVVGTAPDLSGVPAGPYRLTVTEGGCTAVSPWFSVGEPAGPEIDESAVSAVDAACGTATGSVTRLTIENVSGAEAYAWRDSGGSVVGTALDLEDVPPGFYRLTVTDGACSETSGAYEVASATEYEIDRGDIAVADEDCDDSGGSITGLTIGVASGSETYAWTDASGAVVGAAPDLVGVPAGIYTVTVSGASCPIAPETFVVYREPCPPPCGGELVTNGYFDEITACPNSPRQLTRAVAWRAPATVPPGGSSGVGQADLFHGCAGYGSSYGAPNGLPTKVKLPIGGRGLARVTTYSDFESPSNREYLVTELASPMVAGTRYAVSFSYRLWEKSQYVSEELGVHLGVSEPNAYQPGTYVLDVVPQVRTAPGVPLDNVAGWATYSGLYVASGGERFLTLGVFEDSSGQPTGPGTFPLASYSVDGVSVSPAPATLDESAATAQDATCGNADGAVTGVIADGASGAATYEWRDAASALVGTALDLVGVGPGTYTLTVADGGCEVASEPYVVGQASAPTLDEARVTIAPTRCDSATGSVTGITVAGASNRATLTWLDADDVAVGTGAELTDIGPGDYRLLLSDGACQVTSEAYGVAPASVQLDESGTQVAPAACGVDDGRVSGIEISGASPSATYTWRDKRGAVVGTAVGLVDVGSGAYQLTVVDSGCLVRGEVYELTQLPPPTVNVDDARVTPDVCATETGAVYGVAVTDVTAEATFVWADERETPVSDQLTLTGAPAGRYKLTVGDGACEASTDWLTIAGTGSIDLDTSGVTISPAGCGGTDGSIRGVRLRGDGGEATVGWFDGGGALVSSGLPLGNVGSGTYTLRASYGSCADEFALSVPSEACGACELRFSGADVAPATCDSANGSIRNLGFLSAPAEGTRFEWTDDSGSLLAIGRQLINVPAGTYTLNVSGPACGFDPVTLTVGETPCNLVSPAEVRVATALTPDGDGSNDTWFVEGLGGFDVHKVLIYNRWGRKLYESTSYRNDWNGTYGGNDLPEGVYLYVVQPGDDPTQRIVGHLTLLR